MRRLLPLLGVLLLLPAFAPGSAAAAADTRWSEGTALYTTGFNCTSIIFGTAHLEQQTFAYASQAVPADGSLPEGGKPFYVRITFGSIGDICGGGGHVLPELIPPAGVEVVDDPAFPPYWTVYKDGQETRGGDPVVLTTGSFGGTIASVRDLSDGQVKPWIYANTGGFLSVHLALRSTRALNGIGSVPPSCPAITSGAGPCARGEAGDYLQVYTAVADGATPGQLVPTVGLFSTPPPPVVPAPPVVAGPTVGTAPGGPSKRRRLAVVVARSVRADEARRGFPVRVTGLAPGGRVTATLTGPDRRPIMTLTRTASASGTVTLRPRVSRAAAARVRAGGGRMRLVLRIGPRSVARTLYLR